MDEYHGIKISPERDNLFDELGIKRLKESYMTEEETSPQERFAFVAKSFGSDPDHAQRLYDYASKHWLSFATPILSYGRSKSGLPISCFAEGTLVNTKNGLVPIELLNLGDEVLSDDGTYNPIEKIESKDSQDLYELEFMGDVFVVTGNHLIQTREDDWVRVDELDLDYHNIVRLKD